MAARKYSASMDEHLLDDVQQAAEDEGLTVSAFLAQAAADRVALLGLQRLVDDYEADHGAFTDDELARADALLDAAGVANRAQPLRPGS